MQKLHDLAAIMLRLNGFRFYGCSLLLIYDGDQQVQEQYSRGVRAPDEPAKSRRSRSADTRPHTEPISISLSQSQSQVPGRSSRRHSHSRHEHGNSPHHRNRLRGEINLRVVDFAHTTTGRDFVPLPAELDSADMGKGYDTKYDTVTGLAMARFPPKHAQRPDMGFIFGLRSLVRALKEIWADEQEKRRREGEQVMPEMDAVREEDVFERAFAEGFDEGALST